MLYQEVADLNKNDFLIKQIDFCLELNFKKFAEINKLAEVYNSNENTDNLKAFIKNLEKSKILSE